MANPKLRLAKSVKQFETDGFGFVWAVLLGLSRPNHLHRDFLIGPLYEIPR